MAKPQKAVPEPETTALATIQPPGAIEVHDYSQYADAGFENVTENDFAPPLLSVAQSNTPEVKDGLVRYGDFFSRVLGQHWTGPIKIIPVFSTCRYVEWRTRKAGGGFVASHAADSDVALKARKEQPFGKRQVERMIDGNRVLHDLVQTQYLYCLMYDYHEDQWIPMIIPFTSTKLTGFRNFLSKARGLRGKKADGTTFGFPMFAHEWLLEAWDDKNAEGDFKNVRLSLAAERAQDCRLPTTSELFSRAQAYHTKSVAGGVRIDDAQMAEAEGSSSGYQDTPF